MTRDNERSCGVTTKLLTLDEAIAHAESCADNTPCGRDHKQLADWLKELRYLKSLGNAPMMREALEYLLKHRDMLDFCHNNLGSKTPEDWDKVYGVLRKAIEKAMQALAATPRNCDIDTRR